MGFVKSTPSTRCRYAACFTLGFVVASIIIATMFWIIWCYLGLTIVQISDTQRRALVSYSYTTSKPSTTLRPSNRTEVDGALESSLNAISKSPVTPPSQPRRRSDSSTDLAKGDFSARPAQNSTKRESGVPSVSSSTHEQKSSILSGEAEGGLHIRKISTSNTENRAQEESLPERDIKPTQTYAPAQSDPISTAPREERRPISRDSVRKDEIESSRPSYRDPEFDRELPPRRPEPGRRRYDDDYDDRGSPSRYDKRDRGRDTDDRYSKGDTRVYPDKRPRLDDRYPPKDSDRRRGDDRDREDRYRDRDERYRDYDDRYKTRDPEYDPYRDDRRREYDDRYRLRDDRYDDRYPPRDYRYRDDDDRYRDSAYDDKRDRYIPREDEDRYTRSRDRDYREPIMSSRDDIPLDRKSGRPDDARRPSDYDTPIRDRPSSSYLDESRIDDRYRDDDYRRPSKYDDRDRISPSRTRDDSFISRSIVSISRSRDDAYKSGASVIDERKRDDDRYLSNRPTSKYDDDNRRVDESRYISPSSSRDTDSTRRDISRGTLDDEGLERRSSSSEEDYRRENSRTRYYADVDRKPSEDSGRDYRTDDGYPRRTKTDDDDEYRRSRPRGDYDQDRSRIPDIYDRPIDDDDRPPRRYVPEYEESRRRSDADIGLRKETYPRDSKDEDRLRSEGRRPVPPVKDRQYDDAIPPRRSLPDDRPPRSRPDTIDDRPLRPAVVKASEDRRPYRDDTYPEDNKRYKDDIPSNPVDPSRYIPPRSEKREPFISSSTSSRDVIMRDKQYQDSRRTFEDYGKGEERRINVKDVIEAALKQSDAANQNSQIPVYNPRTSNLTSPDIIPTEYWKGTTIRSRRRRSLIYHPYVSMLPRSVIIRKKRFQRGRNL